MSASKIITTPPYRNYYRQRTANQWRKIPAEHGDPSAIRPFLAGNWKMNLIILRCNNGTK